MHLHTASNNVDELKLALPRPSAGTRGRQMPIIHRLRFVLLCMVHGSSLTILATNTYSGMWSRFKAYMKGGNQVTDDMHLLRDMGYGLRSFGLLCQHRMPDPGAMLKSDLAVARAIHLF